mmetsp:Transcript_5688/g.13893  ORF Transcript_5688/g.13893 Transcript_5688/m.13893 type:complete len:272 (+) Transcript_5688:206-1021(+)
MATRRRPCAATRTLSRMSCCRRTASLPCRRRGTTRCGCGTCPRGQPPAALSATPKTSSPWPSPATIAKSSLARATKPSSSGTLSESASLPSKRKATASGSRASASAPTTSHSSSRPAGTSSSKSGTWPPASSRQTSKPTRATSTPSPSPQTAPSAPQAARTASPCCGNSRTASTSTRSRPTTSSTPCASRPTATGCAPPQTRALRFGISSARAWWRSCATITPRPLGRRPPIRRAFRWRGRPTVPPCLPVTPIISFASTRCTPARCARLRT